MAPFSWLVTGDVRRGRAKLNFSEWGGEGGDAHDGAEAVRERTMPPLRYFLAHPGSARLSDADRQALIDALEAMDEGNRGPGGGDGGPGGGDRGGSGGGGPGSG